MPCARSFSPKCYICIQRHISCKWYNFPFFPNKETHISFICSSIKEAYFLYIYIFIYIISYINQLIFFYAFPGQAPYTHRVQRHATLALLFAFYSWLAGRRDVIQAVLQVGEFTNTHTPTIFPSLFCFFCIYTQTTTHHSLSGWWRHTV